MLQTLKWSPNFALLLMPKGAIPYLNSFYGNTSGPIWLDNVHCTGSESNILNCTHNGIGRLSSVCDHRDDSGVECPGELLDLCLKVLACMCFTKARISYDHHIAFSWSNSSCD